MAYFMGDKHIGFQGWRSSFLTEGHRAAVSGVVLHVSSILFYSPGRLAQVDVCSVAGPLYFPSSDAPSNRFNCGQLALCVPLCGHQIENTAFRICIGSMEDGFYLFNSLQSVVSIADILELLH